jgi:hypothetical protein
MRAVINTRQKLTAKVMSTGAKMIRMISPSFSLIIGIDDQIPFIVSLSSKAILSAIIGESAINIHIYPTLITRAIDSKISGISNANPNPTLSNASRKRINVSVLLDPVLNDTKLRIDLYKVINTPTNHSAWLMMFLIIGA